MNKECMVLKVLGSRGSVPVEGERFKVYGGATSCMKLLVPEDSGRTEEIFFDAGSGIVSAKVAPDSNISILISHMHLDHIQGMPFFCALGEKGRKIDIFAAPRNSFKADEAIERLFSPPFWPLRIIDYPADVQIHDIEGSFMIGNVRVDTLEVNHPGGSTTYKLSFNGKTVVYAVDYEHPEPVDMRLAKFVENCDLLIYDGQYCWEEYPGCYGFGHSIPEIGVELAKNANVKQLLITHHSPSHDDSFMHEWEERINKICPIASFAKIGQEICL